MRDWIALCERFSILDEMLLEYFEPHTFLKRLGDVVRLSKQGATAGEIQGAYAAIERMKARAEVEMIEMSADDREMFKQEVDRVLAGLPAEHRRRRSVPKSRWKVGQSVVHDDRSSATDGEIGRIDEIRAGAPVSYKLHWFSLPTAEFDDYEWVREDRLRDLTVDDVERIKRRNSSKSTSSVLISA